MSDEAVVEGFLDIAMKGVRQVNVQAVIPAESSI